MFKLTKNLFFLIYAIYGKLYVVLFQMFVLESQC
jgi:hypothetical protein